MRTCSCEACSCEACSCLELCLETVPWTLLGNRFWEPYLQAVPKNLALLGNLFLDTCLGASFWKLAWERFSPSARKLGVCSHPKNKISNQIFQEQVRKQARLPGKFPSKVPKFPSKGPGNRFPSKVRKTRFPGKVRKNRFTSKGSKNSAPSSQARVPRAGFLAG